MDYLSIGEMSRACGLSEKALHLYQRKGILQPAYVSKETGYRYYLPEQQIAARTIGQLQELGYTLSEIAEVMALDTPEAVAESLRAKADEIERAIETLFAAKRYIEKVLLTCEALGTPPTRMPPRIVEEILPARHALEFEIPDVDESEVDGEQWQQGMNLISHELRKRRAPATLLLNVAGSISEEHIAQRRLVEDRALVFVGKNAADAFGMSTRIKPCRALTTRLRVGTNEGATEWDMARLMLRHAQDAGLKPCGDYLCEVLGQPSVPAFGNEGTLVRLALPVRPCSRSFAGKKF